MAYKNTRNGKSLPEKWADLVGETNAVMIDDEKIYYSRYAFVQKCIACKRMETIEEIKCSAVWGNIYGAVWAHVLGNEVLKFLQDLLTKGGVNLSDITYNDGSCSNIGIGVALSICPQCMFGGR